MSDGKMIERVWRLLVVAEANRAGLDASYVLAIKGTDRRSRDLMWSRANGCRQLASYLAVTRYNFSRSDVARVAGLSVQAVSQICHTIEDNRDDPAFETWISGVENALGLEVAA